MIPFSYSFFILFFFCTWGWEITAYTFIFTGRNIFRILLLSWERMVIIILMASATGGWRRKIYKFQPSKLLLDFLLSLDRSSSNGLQEIGHLFFLSIHPCLSHRYIWQTIRPPHLPIKEEEKFSKNILVCVCREGDGGQRISVTVPGTQSEQIPELCREKQQQSTHTKEKYGNKASPIYVLNKESKSVKRKGVHLY